MMRHIPFKLGRRPVPGDVIAYTTTPSNSFSPTENVLVRRVAAVEGEEMVSDDPEDIAFKIPRGVSYKELENH